MIMPGKIRVSFCSRRLRLTSIARGNKDSIRGARLRVLGHAVVSRRPV
jgi:hypothetical protein